VHGSPLAPIRHDSPHASAQVKSALLLAGLVAGAPVAVTEPSASRDHTERMLAAMGAGITSANGDGRHPIRFEPADALTAIDIDVPGDFSSAAFFLAAAVLRTRGSIRIEHVGVNPTRIGLLPVIERMGVRVRVENERSTGGEPVADLVAQSTALTGTVVEADEVPGMIDEIPVLAILAARAHGETRVTGAAELRVKESDRIASLVRNLREIGVRAEELDDGFVIEGTDAPLAGRVDTAGDHRIAMAFGVLGILPRSHIVIDDPGAASVSYPAFWSQLNALGERGR
jgi:3-phosphoshikimate 1-carboxyvinyltransferase